MRAAPILLGLALAARAAPTEAVSSEELNFSIAAPDSIDWTAQTVDPKADVKAHFKTVFADTEPQAYGEVRLLVVPLSKNFVKLVAKELAVRWKEALEAHLENPRDRKEAEAKLGGQDAWETELQGDCGPGTHHRTWVITKMGAYAYLLVIDRTFKAIGDEDLEAEIKEVRDSFKFLREEKVQAHKEGSDEAPGDTGGGPRNPKKAAGPAIDPKLLEKEGIKDDFWRYKCVKPQGLLRAEMTEEEKGAQAVKLKLSGSKEGEGFASTLLIRVYADTETSKKYTLEQWAESYAKHFKESRKQAKEPEFDKKFKFPLAKDVIKMDLVGRRNTVERESWILADCKNDRQYRIQIYATGPKGFEEFKKEIDQFVDSFHPFDK
ncbi:MAG: hypothetical protein ACREID_06310 [Planctomycetota bacterium]